MSRPEPDMTVKIDVTNPGQFFACCGLLELADRLWSGAEGWFDDSTFHIDSKGNLADLLREISQTDLIQLDAENDTSSPMRLSEPFNLDLDWWTDDLAGGKALKVWAGRMSSVRIARAMQKAFANAPDQHRLFDHGTVVYDPDNPSKKVEPFYFDSRRGWNAQSRDIGFAPDSFNMTTAAFPAVEFLCVVGLQRFRPAPTDRRRIFTYCPWQVRLPLLIASVAASNAITMSGATTYRFQVAFRTDQKKHKSFLPATRQGAFQ